MAVRLKLADPRAASPLRATASVSLATGVWLAGIRVVDAGGQLRVLFPSSVSLDSLGQPQVQSVLEFESAELRAKWEQRILQEYRATAGGGAPDAKPAAKQAPRSAPRTARAAAPAPATAPKSEEGRHFAPDAPAPPGYLVAYFDGGSRGNPGPGAAGALLELPGQPPAELVRFLGHTTNNAAEYTAVLMILEEIARLREQGLPVKQLTLRGDSLLVVKQMQGIWKLKDRNLAQLANQCYTAGERLKIPIKYEHVPRERNTRADELVSTCLDQSAAT